MRLTIQALDGIPRVEPGDDLAGLLIAALEAGSLAPRGRDVLVVTSKIVSKAEGRDPSGRPREVPEVGLAAAVGASAVLAMGEAAEGPPAALVRGLDWSAPTRPASALIRPRPEDLFR